VPVSLRMATNRICQSDCHEESCGNAMYDVACSIGTSARLFPGERDGRRLAHGNGQVDRLLQGSYERGRVAAVGTLVKVGIHHIAVTVRAAGR
jgi:hypothetical protein